jgi:hypothetical protein
LNGRPRAVVHILRREWPLSASVATAALFFVFDTRWLADLSRSVWFAFMLAWLFGAIMVSAFAVVRHAEARRAARRTHRPARPDALHERHGVRAPQLDFHPAPGLTVKGYRLDLAGA